MGLDLRWPIGLMFTFIGALLVVYGAATNSDPMYQHSLGKNINLIWGVVLLIFGVLMLLGAIRGGKKPPTA
jgi:drug/metabolite transporter (DMT)-like permease